MSDKPALPLTIDTLGDVDDGTVRLLVDRAVAEALRDCDSRPGLAKARTVTLTIAFAPVMSDFGGMKGVETAVGVKTSLPTREARPEYLMTSVAGDDVSAYLPTARPAPLFTTKRDESAS